MKTLTIAIGTTTSVVGDAANNLRQIALLAGQAAHGGADLLLTPELSASGYGGYPEVLALAEDAGTGPIGRALLQIAAHSGVAIAAGFPERSGDKTFLAHGIAFPNGRFEVQRKHRVTAAEQPFDAPFALRAPNSSDTIGVPEHLDFNIIEVRGVRCALVICADLGIENLNPHLSNHGVELLLCPTGAGGAVEGKTTPQSDIESHVRRLEETCFNPFRRWVGEAMEYRRAFAAVNMSGHDGRDYFHIGNGIIISARGEIEALLPPQVVLGREKPALVCATVEIL